MGWIKGVIWVGGKKAEAEGESPSSLIPRERYVKSKSEASQIGLLGIAKCYGRVVRTMGKIVFDLKLYLNFDCEKVA